LSTATNGGCTDSTTFIVRVLENPVADFTINSICIEIPVEINNKTINAAAVPLDYLWDFGNGHTATGVNPVYSYPAPGNYTVKLTVNISQCPSIIFTKRNACYNNSTAARYYLLHLKLNFIFLSNCRQGQLATLCCGHQPPVSTTRQAIHLYSKE
jgi:hypothetical protein